MSSLPPYNPRLGDHAVWLLPVERVEQLPARLPGAPAGWNTVYVDEPALGSALAAMCQGAAVEVVLDWTATEIPPTGWTAVAGRPGFAEAALRRVMGMPAGSARFVLIPAAVSVVQLLPDRAVLVRLNDGYALDARRA